MYMIITNIYIHIHVYCIYILLVEPLKSEILSFNRKWMEPEIIILSEVSQTYKDEQHTFYLICRLP